MTSPQFRPHDIPVSGPDAMASPYTWLVPYQDAANELQMIVSSIN